MAKAEKNMYYVYILKSLKNNKSYVGKTSRNVKIRLREHNNKSNKWTRENGPFKLIYYEKFYCLKDASYRERFLKSGQGRKLLKLILNHFKGR